MPSYTPPPGGSVTLHFGDSAYTAPTASSVTFELDGVDGSTIYATSIFDDGYGTPVLLWTQFASDVTLGDVSAFGVHDLDFHRLRPAGIDSTLVFGTPYLYLGQQWALPESIVVEAQAGHRVYADDWYTYPPNLPDGGSLTIEFGSTAYTPPPSAAITLELEPPSTPTIFATSISDGAFGDATVENYLAYVTPASISDGALGTAAVTQPPVILPTGIDQSALGFSGDGTGAIDFARRHLEPASMSASAIGTQRVENQNRGIDLAGLAPLGTAFGTQFIAYKERFLRPTYIFANAFGTAVLGFDRELVPVGIDSAEFGVADVHDNTQAVQSVGLGRADAVSIPDVSRSPRIIAPPGFDLREIAPSERWGLPEVYNLTQILPRVAIDPDPENGGVFGEPNNTLVENRNRTIGHFGHRDSVVSGLAVIENTGRALVATGVDGEAFGTHLVADAIRTYQLEGIEPSWFTPYHAVYNAAFQALPSGINESAVGTPAWANPPQNLTFVGHIDSQEHGTAFVDFAIRYVAPPLGPEATFGQDHVVELKTRYLAPSGMDATRWGATYVFEHFNIAYAQSILAKPVGEPFVRNVTPEVTPYGYEQTEWGVPTVRWNPWPIAPEGFVGSNYGALVIRDRRQTIAPTPAGIGGVGMFAQVRNDSPDPPSNRTIAVDGATHSAYGQATLRRNEIHPTGLVATLFGSHEVRLVGALVPSLAMPTDQVPGPYVRGPQYIELDGILAPDDPLSDFTPTMHDLQPRTVWATFDVTEQAKRIHGGEWTLMDDHLDTVEPRGQRPFFGRPAVTLLNRRITVSNTADGLQPQELGAPAVESTIRTIYPAGRLMQRFGVASLPGEQVVDHDLFGSHDGAVGGDTVVANINRELRPGGIAGGEMGAADPQLFNRELPAPSLGEGSPGTPRVHLPEPIIPGMGVQTLWGSSTIDFRIRTLYPSGWDGARLDNELGEFPLRMRVARRSPIRPVAIGPGDLGGPRISDAIQRIQYAALPAPGKPPAPSIEINNKIALGGMGEWFGGYGEHVITHGDNMDFVCGSAPRAIPVAGIDGGAFGAPVVGAV